MILSVIVLTYNQEQTIAKTLQSILSQEHTYSMEILVGDDASSDSTAKIISDFSRKNSNVIKPIIRDKNIGLINNYFDLIKRATGEHIMVCAGDDYWLPGKIKNQMSYMHQHPECGMCYSGALILNGITGRIDGCLTGYSDNSFKALLQCNHIPAVSICFRKDKITKYISDINPQNKDWLMEDYPFVLWMSLYSSIHYIPEILCVYRKNTHSVSHSPDLIKYLNFERNVLDIREFFLTHTLDKKELSKIRQQLIIQQLKLHIVNPSNPKPSHVPYKFYVYGGKSALKIIALSLLPKCISRLYLTINNNDYSFN